MRRTLGILSLGLSLLAAYPTSASAKTQLEISPQSGPTGTIVRVEGSGFCDGEVLVFVVAAGALPQAAGGGFFVEKDKELPPHIELGRKRASSGGFEIQAMIPAAPELRSLTGIDDPQALQIVAEATGEPGCNQSHLNFMTGQTFTVTNAALPVAGSKPEGNARRVDVLAATGAIAGILLLFAARLMRRQAQGH